MEIPVIAGIFFVAGSIKKRAPVFPASYLDFK
jgi:hypothetical protein